MKLQKMIHFYIDIALTDSSGGSLQRLYPRLKSISDKIPTFYIGQISTNPWISFDLGEIQLVNETLTVINYVSKEIKTHKL